MSLLSADLWSLNQVYCYGKAHSRHSSNCTSDENLFVGKNFFDLKVEKNVESVMV